MTSPTPFISPSLEQLGTTVLVLRVETPHTSRQQASEKSDQISLQDLLLDIYDLNTTSSLILDLRLTTGGLLIGLGTVQKPHNQSTFPEAVLSHLKL